MTAYQNPLSYSAVKLPERIPVFPLPNVVLFPHIELPLYIFEPRYRKMLRDCMKSHKFMAISLFKEGWQTQEEPIPSHEIVGVGYVRAVFENPDGTSHILLKGVGRARIQKYYQMKPYRAAQIRTLEEKVENATELEGLAKKLKKVFSLKLRLDSERPQEKIQIPKRFQNPIVMSYLACFMAQIPAYLKQDLLEESNCNGRMRHLIHLLEEEINPPSRLN